MNILEVFFGIHDYGNINNKTDKRNNNMSKTLSETRY